MLMYTQEQEKQNYRLMLSELRKLVAEAINAVPDELRICNRIKPQGIYLKDGKIVIATGKRVDGYTAGKFYDAFCDTLDSINREVVEELILQLQKDAVEHQKAYCCATSAIQFDNYVANMYLKYQMLFQNTKYRGVKIDTAFVRPVNEFMEIPFSFRQNECYTHEFFNMDLSRYNNYMFFIWNGGGSIRYEYEQFRACNQAQ